MPNDKTPGSDGLSVNFYKVFWQELKYDLCQVFNKCFERGELCPSMRRGIITLLPKQGKDNLYLKNWRPISLLNTDYKILAKLIANRLKKVLSLLICSDQTGFMKKRYTGENIRLFLDMIEFCKTHSVDGLAFSIDFEKAFDSIKWNLFINA